MRHTLLVLLLLVALWAQSKPEDRTITGKTAKDAKA